MSLVFYRYALRVSHIFLFHPPYAGHDYRVELDFGFAPSLSNVDVRRVVIIEIDYEFEAVPSQHCWHYVILT